MIAYLTTNDVLAINERFVGADMVRDVGIVDGAIMRPQASAFGGDAFVSIHEKAGALMHALTRNHPFVNGNKRTAWTATAMFYMINGYNLPVDAGDVVALVNDAAEGLLGVQDIAQTLKSWAQPFPPDDDWMGNS